MLAALLAITVPLFAAPQQPDPAALQQELTGLVDLSSPKARAIAAERLAKKKLATLEQWLQACAAFGTFEPLEAGITQHLVPLSVLGTREETEVFLYVPKGYDPSVPAPMLLWGHGAGGRGAREYLHWQRTADRLGMLVLAPTEFAAVPGWGSTERERYAQLAVLRWARRVVNVDENAIFVGGASRGGHMTWDLALRFPDLWAGALPCIGGPRLNGRQNNTRYLENVASLPLRDLQGSGDDPLLLKTLREMFGELQRLQAKDAVLHEFPELGHSFDLGAVDWTQFFANRREAWPERVVRLAAEPEWRQRRAAWVTITAVERGIRPVPVLKVSAAAWSKLDEDGQRRLAHKKFVQQTARLQVTDQGKGRFVARSDGVRSFELLLSADMLGRDGAVEVRWNSRRVRKTARPDVQVLLADFAERFDRTRLPVARVKVP